MIFNKKRRISNEEDPYKDRYVAVTKKGRRDKKEVKADIASTLFLVPSLVGVAVFFLIPFCIVIYYSMIDNPIHHEFVWFDNFVMLFKNLAFRKAALNTLVFSIVSVPLAVVLSLLLAIALEWKLPFKSQFRSFFLSPMMVPTASVVLIWQVLFHTHGTANAIIEALGGQKVDWLYSKYSLIVVVILFIWKNLGYNMILFMAALSSVPDSLVEAASLERITRWQIFWTVKFRYITSTILFVTIMSLINSFKVFREVYLLKGDYPYESIYLLQHFMNNTFHNLDYQKMSSAAVVMAIVMTVIIWFMFRAEAILGKDVEDE